MTTDAAPKKKRPMWHWIVAAVGALVICGVIGSMLPDSDKPEVASGPTSAPRDTVDPSSAATDAAERKANANAIQTEVAGRPTETPEPPSFKDGTLLVGTDVQPGIYRTANDSGSCYYSRLSGVSGELEDIISNDNPSGPTIVEIVEGDEAFKSERCGKWVLDAGSGGANATSFGDGTYMVGRDIQPGRYRNEGHELCYYVRLADFRGGLDSIISNENTDAQAIVDIAASDAGFSSTRCGTWTKVE